MKSQEDIGSLIKTKLQATEKVSNEATWERIQHSLEERKQKRRFAFYIKLGSAGLLVLIGVLFIINYSSHSSINTTVFEEKTTIENVDTKAISIEEKASYEVAPDVTAGTDPKNNEENEVQDLKINKKQETPTSKSVVKSTTTQKESNIKEQPSKGKTKNASNVVVIPKEKNPKTTSPSHTTVNTMDIDTIVNRNDVPVTQTTQKVYYYYNSKDGQEMKTTNKKEIDSIIKANQIKTDSLKTNH
ncbi:hypothetical protein [uncultured Dokdonia sp.]|uniref:hypothetical protein n=1 Tax=uncultured Dokdonia sp. TaxID=575653 RepID=UPI00262A4159|nr:hypothetical protein [uncultured Dokdonia sp.]